MKHFTPFKRIIGTAAVGLMLLLAPAMMLSTAAYAAPTDANGNPCGGGNKAAQAILGGINNSDAGPNCGDTKVKNTFGLVVNLLSLIAGILSVIVIIYAGLKYMTSGGEQSKVANAKSTLIYAIVGLAVAGLAQGLVHFVIYRTNAV